MLSYQHSFHAGNHGDVLKHITLCALISHLCSKTKPFFYLDTHAGSACYEISERPSNDPILALRLPTNDHTPAIVKHYLSIVQAYLAKSTYPGSPLIISEMLSLLTQSNDALSKAISNSNLQLNELHPSAFEALQMWTQGTEFGVHQRDAYEVLNAHMPPKPNRGIVLIDPPYEQAGEYKQVLGSVSSALKKWPNGIYCIWYPLLSERRINRHSGEEENTPKHGLSEDMLLSFTEVAKSANIGLLDTQFVYQSPSTEIGMYGSGLAIFNPPWRLDHSLQEVLGYLNMHGQLEQNELSSLNWLVPAP